MKNELFDVRHAHYYDEERERDLMAGTGALPIIMPEEAENECE